MQLRGGTHWHCIYNIFIGRRLCQRNAIVFAEKYPYFSDEVTSCLHVGLKVRARISHTSIRLSAQFAAAIVVGKRHGPVQRYRNQSRRSEQAFSRGLLEYLRPDRLSMNEFVSSAV